MKSEAEINEAIENNTKNMVYLDGEALYKTQGLIRALQWVIQEEKADEQ